MTIDEAIKELKDASDSEIRYGDTDHHYDEVMKRVEAFDLAIKALEQQPCEDCISRQAVLDIINFEDEWLFDAKSHNADTKIAFSTIKSKISELPSVTLTSDAEDKYDIGYNCGYADAMSDIAGSEG